MHYLLKILSRCLAILLFALFQTVNGQPSIYINEFMAKNLSSGMEKDFYAFSDWIEIYNPNSVSLDLSGYAIKYDSTQSVTWKIPGNTSIDGGGYLLIWADRQSTKLKELHASFTLQQEGGTISLLNPSNQLVHSVTYGEQKTDVSYGIDPQLNTQWLYFSVPSPGTLNTYPAVVDPVRTPAPEFSIHGGVYENEQLVSISCASPGATIFFTLDGSKPTLNSTIYQTPFIVNSTRVIRAIAYDNTRLPSRTTTHTYLINEGISLPIISISMNHEYFWDDEIGFYVEGTNGVPGGGAYGPSPASNFNQKWRRPMNLEFFDEDHQFAFSTEGSVKVYGGWSRGAIIKSLAIYPEKALNYQLFREKPFVDYESFILRNSGNDWPSTKIRDAALQSLAINQFDIDLQANRPAVLFINGEFWGVLNIREKINEDYIHTNHGVDQTNVDFLEKYNVVKSGDRQHYVNMMNYLSSHPLNSQSNMDHFKTLVDVEECLNYFITGIYSGHGDWIYNGNNNLRLWRPRTAEGKWRWLLYDTDGAFQSSSGRGIANAMATSTILAGILQNDQAKNYFINTFTTMLNNAFSPDRAIGMIDSLKLLIEPDVGRHIQKWKNIDESGNPATWKTPGAEGYIQIGDGYMGPSLSSFSEWESKFNSARYVAQNRPAWLLSEIQSLFGLGEQVEMRFRVSDSNAGMIEVDHIPVLDYIGYDTYLAGQSLRIKALPKYGYKFSHWEVGNYNSSSQLLIQKKSEWKYLDDGSNQGTAWRDVAFSDLSWDKGFGELGYGDGGEATLLGYGGNSSNKYTTTYFRKDFTVSDPLAIEELKLNILYDDGLVIYINGSEVERANMPSGTINYLTLAASAIGGAGETTYSSLSVSADQLVSGNNTIAVEIHQSSLSSSDISFDMEMLGIMTGSADSTVILTSEFDHAVTGNAYMRALFDTIPTPKSLFINEILATNVNLIWPNATTDQSDWIEIYNGGETTKNLGGMYISDDPDNPRLYRIPESDLRSTQVLPGGHLILYADGMTKLGSNHLNIKLNSEGESLILSREIAHELVIIDTFSFQKQIMDISYGRYPDGAGQLYFMPLSTPEASNRLENREPVSGLYINEVVTDNLNGITDNYGENEDWIELYNLNDHPLSIAGLFLTDDFLDPGKWRIPFQYRESTTIPPGGYLILWADGETNQGVTHLNFKLNQGGDQVGLFQLTGNEWVLLDSISLHYQPGNRSVGRYPDGQNVWFSFDSITPGTSNYMLNSTASSLSDQQFVIYPNPSNGLVNIKIIPAVSKSDGNYVITVYGINGQKVLVKDIDQKGSFNSEPEQIDLSGFPGGVYFIKIQSPGAVVTRKIIIK